MQLRELIDALQKLADLYPEDEVLVATESSWPVPVQLRTVRSSQDDAVWLVLDDTADDPYTVSEEGWA